MQKSRPFFSVVIPLYNKELYIGRSLRSVLNQTFQDFEVIVVDDGSTDGGPKLIQAIGDSRIRLIQQLNAGVSSARNRGIKEAKADYIAFLDADDEWSSGFLLTIMRLIKKFPSAGLFATSYTIVAEDIERKTRSHTLSYFWEGLLPNYFEVACGSDPPICSSAVCLPIKVLLESGAFQEGVFSGEDLLLWARIALHHRVAYSNKSCAIYYRNIPHSVHDTYKAQIHRADWVKFQQEAIKDNAITDKIINYIAWQIYLQSKTCILLGHQKDGLNLLRKCHGSNFLIKRIALLVLSYIPFPLISLLLPFYCIKSKIKKSA